MNNNTETPILCGVHNCTGCSSCANSCPQSAITMIFNSEGYYAPSINKEKCIGCHICEKHCPIKEKLIPNQGIPQAYICWTKDDKVREQSSSGGAFTILVLQILKEGGYVWGAGYSDNMEPIYKCINCIEDLNQIRGSKYVQCKIGNSYKIIKNQLKEGKKVAFCGTPCHIAGLYSYLNGQLLNNLTTIDFICHGVPSPLLFNNYIKWLEHKYNDKVTNYNFRDSKFGTNYNIGTSITFEKKGKKYLYLKDNSYTLGFCKNLTIHNACTNCNFDGTKRNSDFTIGDYHGAKGEFSSYEQLKGISCLIVNSNKAFELLKQKDTFFQEIPLDKIIKSNPSYTKHKATITTLDLTNIASMPYSKVQSQYFKPTIKDIVKTATMLFLGSRITYIIKNFK